MDKCIILRKEKKKIHDINIKGEPYPCIQSISITAQSIAQLLQELYPSKATSVTGHWN